MSRFRRRLMKGSVGMRDGEVTYIESTGQQWIDTGLEMNPDYVWELDVRFTKIPTSWQEGVLGAYYSNTTSPRCALVVWPSTGANTGFAYPTGTTISGPSAPMMTLGTVPTLNTLYSFRFQNVSSNYSGGNAWLFARHNDNNNHTMYDGMQLLGCRVYTTGGVTLREYIPWVKNGSACLYDAVNDTYVYSGTGIDFIAGARVPYDARVDYLMSDGTAFIDTGIKPYYNDAFDVRFKFGTLGPDSRYNNASLIGCVYDWQDRMWGLYWNIQETPIWVSGSNYGNASITRASCQSAWHHISGYDSNKYFDYISKGTYTLATGQSTFNAAVFGLMWRDSGNVLSTSTGTQKYISDYAIADYNGLIKQRCRSVRVGNVGYMYDIITGNLLGTASQTAFTVGGDTTRPYDAEVAYLTSSGSEYISTDIRLDYSKDFTIDAVVRIPSDVQKRMCICGNYGGAGVPNAFSFEVYNNPVNGLRVFTKKDETITSDVTSLSFPKNTLIAIHIAYSSANKTISLSASGGNITDSFVANVTNTAIGQNTASLCLFLDWRADTSAIANPLDIATISVAVNGIKVIDYKAVRRGTIGYMYDAVSNTLKANQGTGAFIVGPDKS